MKINACRVCVIDCNGNKTDLQTFLNYICDQLPGQEYTIAPSVALSGASCGSITPDVPQVVAAGSNITFTFEPCPCPPPAEYPVVGWAFNDDDPYIFQFSPDPVTVPEGVQINLFDSSGPVVFDGEGIAYVPSLAMLVMFMSNGDMYLVDPYNTTASAANPNVTFVGATGLNFPQGAEVYFNPNTGVETLYVVDDDEQLVVVDVNTAAVLSAVPITGAYNNGDGLSINPLTGVAYVQNDDTVAFYQINLTTGVTVACFRTPPVDGEGIAFGADGYMYIEDEGQWGGERRIYRFLPPACGTGVVVTPTDFVPVAAYTNLGGDVEGKHEQYRYG